MHHQLNLQKKEGLLRTILAKTADCDFLKEKEDLLRTTLAKTTDYNSLKIALSLFDLPIKNLVEILIAYNAIHYSWFIEYLTNYLTNTPKIDIFVPEIIFNIIINLIENDISKLSIYFTKPQIIAVLSTEQKQALLKLAIKHNVPNKKNLDLKLFDLPFQATLETALSMLPLSVNSLTEYLKKFSSPDLYEIKKMAILSIIKNHGPNFCCIDETNFIFLNEVDRIFIIEKLLEDNIHTNIILQYTKKFKITKILTRLKFFLQILALDPDMWMTGFAGFNFSQINGSIGKLFSILEKYSPLPFELTVLDHAIIFKTKILGNKEFWANKAFLQKELDFLIKYSITDERTATNFIDLTKSLIYTLLVNNIAEVDQKFQTLTEFSTIQNVLKEIRSFADPEQRYILTYNMLVKIFTNQQLYSTYCDLIANKGQTLLLPTIILLSKIPNDQILNFKQDLIKVLTHLQKHNKKHKDSKHMRPLIAGLTAIFSQAKLTIREKFSLTYKILNYDFNHHKHYWWLIEAILNSTITDHPKFNKFYEMLIQGDPQQVFIMICMEIFNINKQNIDKFATTFGQRYNQTALLIYYSKLQDLPEIGRTAMLDLLQQYVNSVLSDHSQQYYAQRYKESSNPQLQIIFNNYPWLYSNWKTGFTQNYNDFIAEHELIPTQQEFNLLAKKHPNWTIVDTDHYWSMFMAGSDVYSCQRVDGNLNSNKCLMGYVMNGDYRMLAIQNEKGITIARCIMHLVWEPINKTAVLFLEKLYPQNGITDLQIKALYQLAIKRAASLGLTLATLDLHKNPGSTGYNNPLSYNNPLIRIAGGGAPWVYCDAGGGSEYIAGEYTIPCSKVLYYHYLYYLEYKFYSAYNYLVQAWNNKHIQQITWQQIDEKNFRPVAITWQQQTNAKKTITQLFEKKDPIKYLLTEKVNKQYKPKITN